jgi:D-glycero-D-manno-heptose 1,7-bisphosphate phosphatase
VNQLSQQPLILLDRDGCLNYSPTKSRYVLSFDELRLFPDVIEFSKNCINAGMRLAVATNQRGISLNLCSLDDVKKIHKQIFKDIDNHESEIQLYCCPHKEDECDCRKPKPGMLIAAMVQNNADPKLTFFIGNMMSDYQAACNAKVQFIGIRRIDDLSDFPVGSPVDFPIFDNLFEVFRQIVRILDEHLTSFQGNK